MSPSRGPWLGRIHALTILLSAFLLFQVQPLLSKWILPWFGGGPAVWTTCVLFFQTALFAGYAYAHVSERCLPVRVGIAVHLALILAAAWLLPIAPGDRWKPEGSGDPTGRILLLLTVTVGAPYVLLSSTGPLVQAWFARAYPDRSPYRLYALSNVGSLAALLTYPFVVEPLWGLRTQSTAWMGMFLAFAVLYAAGAISVAGIGRAEVTGGATDEPAPSRRRKALWIILPAFASGMLLATTQQLCQDVAVIPFLWILPLAVYLVSFILAFDRPGWYSPRIIAPCTAALVLAAAILFVVQPARLWLIALGILVTLAALFGLCMLCHGELARLKPASRHLTSYYLAISGGGALGGLFVALVAPQVFSTFLEWKVGMGIAYVAAWARFAGLFRGRIRAHLNVAAVLFVVAILGLAFIGAFFGSYRARLDVARNFYGVVAVEDNRGAHDMVNGRILHGRQFMQESLRKRPTTYYVEASGIGRLMTFFRERKDLRVGVVGLGAGSLAVYGKFPSQSFRFYEINPDVERMARKHFLYLQDCPARVEVVIGDARRSMEHEAPQRFHVLALDAFSGDAIPTHLLTTEAMGIYLRHLEPDGVIAIHISNRSLDLAPLVRGVSRQSGLGTIDIDFTNADGVVSAPSRWILCTRSEAAMRELGGFATKSDDSRETVWTDDRSDLFSVLKRR